jgi:putative endonuclease
MEKINYVYIFDSAPHLFIGVTGDLEKRAAQPRRKLVWFEPHQDLTAAIAREKQLKRWNRAWKAKLVSNHNPEWRDLMAGSGLERG